MFISVKTGLGGEIYLQPKNALDDIPECNGKEHKLIPDLKD